MRVLDLFAGLGGWSAPLVERGHEVITVDLDPAFGCTYTIDVMEYEPDGTFDLVLASPPCEGFSVMNIGKNWYHDHTPKTQSARLAMDLLQRTLVLIEMVQPSFFIIENPVGKMRRMRSLAELERRTITQCQYGMARMKPTDLWGGFPPSLVLRSPCQRGAPCHVAAPRGSQTPGSTQGTKSSPERAMIPYELALAVAQAASLDLEAGRSAASVPTLFDVDI